MDVAQLNNDEKVIIGRLFIWQTGIEKRGGRARLAKRNIGKKESY